MRSTVTSLFLGLFEFLLPTGVLFIQKGDATITDEGPIVGTSGH